MARNCGPHFDINRVVTHNKFDCNYVGEGIVDGKVVTHPRKEWKGRLASCSEYGVGISDEVMRDVKDYVYEIAGGDDFQLDRNKFQCRVTTIPLN